MSGLVVNIDMLNASPVRAVQAKTIARALRMYAKTGMRMNSAYTPRAMFAAATNITGLNFKRGDYERAAQACELAAEAIMQIAAIVRENPDIDAAGVEALLVANDRKAEDLQLAAK